MRGICSNEKKKKVVAIEKTLTIQALIYFCKKRKVVYILTV